MPPQPRKAFTLTTDPTQPQTLRDKDNAAPRIKPPHLATRPAFNLAPPGTAGIKRSEQIGHGPRPDKPAKRFTLGKGGDLTNRFQPIARKGQDKDKNHGWER